MITKKDITKTIGKLKIFDEKMDNIIGSIIYGFQRCKKLRISNISAALPGNYESNSKSISRALDRLGIEQLRESLLSFVVQGTKHALLDLTEMARNDAVQTDYVGYLKDGKTRGYNILSISIPFKGRSKVVFATIISSAIIASSATGKWKLIQEALAPLIPILQSMIIIIDREFCNEEMLNFFQAHNIRYAIRLKVGAGRSEIIITNKTGRRISISIQRGTKKNWEGIYYKGKVRVNIAAEWQSHMPEPMYVITNCPARGGLKCYKIRMKIEESFKDVKDKLGFIKIMNKKVVNALKLILIGLLAYNIFMLIGEYLRDIVLSPRERRRFSGLHVLFNLIYRYTRAKLRRAVRWLDLYLSEDNIDGVVRLRAFRSC
jgi:hypothetical protein